MGAAFVRRLSFFVHVQVVKDGLYISCYRRKMRSRCLLISQQVLESFLQLRQCRPKTLQLSVPASDYGRQLTGVIGARWWPRLGGRHGYHNRLTNGVLNSKFKAPVPHEHFL